MLNLKLALSLAKLEIKFARNKYPKFDSWMKAHKVIQDELDEFKASLEKGEPDPAEILSVGAMSFLSIIELCQTEFLKDKEAFIEKICRGMPKEDIVFAKKLVLLLEMME